MDEKKEPQAFKVQQDDGSFEEVKPDHYLFISGSKEEVDAGGDLFCVYSMIGPYQSEQEKRRWEVFMSGILANKAILNYLLLLTVLSAFGKATTTERDEVANWTVGDLVEMAYQKALEAEDEEEEAGKGDSKARHLKLVE